jgi:hypothetical protein
VQGPKSPVFRPTQLGERSLDEDKADRGPPPDLPFQFAPWEIENIFNSDDDVKVPVFRHTQLDERSFNEDIADRSPPPDLPFQFALLEIENIFNSDDDVKVEIPILINEDSTWVTTPVIFSPRSPSTRVRSTLVDLTGYPKWPHIDVRMKDVGLITSLIARLSDLIVYQFKAVDVVEHEPYPGFDMVVGRYDIEWLKSEWLATRMRVPFVTFEALWSKQCNVDATAEGDYAPFFGMFQAPTRHWRWQDI